MNPKYSQTATETNGTTLEFWQVLVLLARINEVDILSVYSVLRFSSRYGGCCSVHNMWVIEVFIREMKQPPAEQTVQHREALREHLSPCYSVVLAAVPNSL